MKWQWLTSSALEDLNCDAQFVTERMTKTTHAYAISANQKIHDSKETQQMSDGHSHEDLLLHLRPDSHNDNGANALDFNPAQIFKTEESCVSIMRRQQHKKRKVTLTRTWRT